MNEEILKIREELVALSSDAIATRALLDKLTEKEIEQHDAESFIHLDKKDILQEVDRDTCSVKRTRNGLYLRFYGGYDILIDEKLLTTANAAELLMEDVSKEKEEDREAVETAQSAVDMIFRLPMFVFSHPYTTYNIATMATRYLLLLQDMGEVPTEETENPELDKFFIQMNELMENFAAGLEKEGLEYERRNGISHGEEKTEGESQSESKSEEKS